MNSPTYIGFQFSICAPSSEQKLLVYSAVTFGNTPKHLGVKKPHVTMGHFQRACKRMWIFIGYFIHPMKILELYLLYFEIGFQTP